LAYNQLSQEDLLVRVKGVDDQVHQLTDLGLEAVLLPPNEASDSLSESVLLRKHSKKEAANTHPKVSVCADILFYFLFW
jgi:hypothetical protein